MESSWEERYETHIFREFQTDAREVLVGFNEHITGRAMRTLRIKDDGTGEWLSDDIINGYTKLLIARDERTARRSSKQRRSHFFDTHFLTELLDVGRTNKYCYENVRRWGKRVPGGNSFLLDKIFFPINISNTHWVLAVAFMTDRVIKYYDSMGGNGTYYLTELKNYLQQEWVRLGNVAHAFPDCKLENVEGAPRQENSWDCGLFVCFAMNLIAKNVPLDYD